MSALGTLKDTPGAQRWLSAGVVTARNPAVCDSRGAVANDRDANKTRASTIDFGKPSLITRHASRSKNDTSYADNPSTRLRVYNNPLEMCDLYPAIADWCFANDVFQQVGLA